MSDKTSPLGDVHRVVTWTSPSGSLEVIDDTVPIKTFAHGTQVATLFVQPDAVGSPTKGEEYAKAQATGFIPASGDNVFAFDMPPGMNGPSHFTQSLDYIVVVKGTIQVETVNGKKYDLKTGDVTINLGNVHNFNNPTDEWSRAICIITHAEPFKSTDGKGLKEIYPDAMAA